jgi:hypothetical protein
MGGVSGALILHGVMRAGDAAALGLIPDMFGKGDACVVALDGPAAGMSALVSACPAGVDAAGLFGDAQRTEGFAVAHNRILSAACEHHDVLPVRLGAVFGSDAALREGLGAQAPALAARLEALSGGVEYGVKITLNNTPNNTPNYTRQPQTAPAADTGRGYLRQRGLQRDAARDGARHAAAEANAVIAALSQLAMDSRNRPSAAAAPQARAFAFLVRRAGRDMFEAKAEALAAGTGGGLSLQITGPWPPYSFAGEA